MIKQWRDVNTRNRVSVLARQILKNVKGDLTQLNQSQRDMLAAVAIRDRGLSMDMAMYEFNAARSSVGFARTLLRFAKPQLVALALHGTVSVHKLDELRRKLGSEPLATHLLGLTDEQITKRYAVRGPRMRRARTTSRTRKADAPTTDYAVAVERIVDETGTDTPAELSWTQKRAQTAANARWAKASANKPVKGLPIVSATPAEVEEWNATSINRALKVITTARDLAQVGDLKGARQLLKVVGMALQEA